MVIDFSPIENKEVQFLEFSRNISRTQLRDATNESIDTLRGIIEQASDPHITFVPHDPDAYDPHAATEAEQHIGWTLGHLVVHVTASSEEDARFSAILAAGIPVGGRLRYETPWESITTVEQCLQRLEESRRMRLSYLRAWPDTPQLDVLRELSPKFRAVFGDFNATAAFLFGLHHEIGHYAQFREVLRQAQVATQRA